MMQKGLNKKTEERIFRAAMKLLVLKGFDGNSYREISKKTKISETLISSFFEGNSLLLNELFRSVGGSMCA